ncbi:MAG: histidine--tRNA ligase [Gemmataceae bacterium]|nr:histidine--tRNA ligase [Gemmataceae bacterium]
MADLIEPRTLQGFRDYPPELMIPRERLLEKAREVYRSYGYAPIDTPALEYAEILLGKMSAEAEIQRQLYRFTDSGERDVALRFDLTVPFARFAAEHIGKLGTPFKRYHMGPVWRGERPQKGRFREFWQCDFDTIGTTSNAADIETALVIHDLMRALGFERFQIRVNNRLILKGVLEIFGLTDKADAVLRVVDKLRKVGREAVHHQMTDTFGLKYEQATEFQELLTAGGPNAKKLDSLRMKFAGMQDVQSGVDRLEELLEVAEQSGIDASRLYVDLSIARGLDYYTGTIYETYLDEKPEIGSVCSGGRYDNLASLYTKQVLPGVGASLGLDRLLAAMEELKMLPAVSTPAEVLMVQFDAAHLGDYQKMARALRAEGIGVEVYPDAKKIGAQLSYAEKRGFRVALIAGGEEFSRGVWKVKDLKLRQEQAVPTAEVAGTIRKVLAGA